MSRKVYATVTIKVIVNLDDEVMELTGMSADDLPDYAYWDSWNNGDDADFIARQVVIEAGFEDLMEEE